MKRCSLTSSSTCSQPEPKIGYIFPCENRPTLYVLGDEVITPSFYTLNNKPIELEYWWVYKNRIGEWILLEHIPKIDVKTYAEKQCIKLHQKDYEYPEEFYTLGTWVIKLCESVTNVIVRCSGPLIVAFRTLLKNKGKDLSS